MNNPQHYPPPLGDILDGGNYGSDGDIIYHADNVAFSETHLFSPTLINQVRFGYNYGDFAFQQLTFNQPDLAASLGMGGIPSGGLLGGGLPLVSVGGISGFGPPRFYPNHKAEDVYQISDDITKIIGNQSFKFGILLQSTRFPFFSPPNARGTYDYSGFFTSKPGQSQTGFGVADFLEDQMNSATVPTFSALDFSHWNRAGYGEDDWRITRTLTLNLGLRYDYFKPVKEVSGRFANFYMQPLAPGNGNATLTYVKAQQGAALSPKFLSLLSAAAVPIKYTGNNNLVNAQKTDFAPCLGFAYMIDSKTVIRGDFGLFYAGQENTGGPETLQNYPFQFTANFPMGAVCEPGNCATDGIFLGTGFAAQLSAGLLNNFGKPSFNGSQPDVKNTIRSHTTCHFNIR